VGTGVTNGRSYAGRPRFGSQSRLGLVEVPLPATEYARANIKMVLDLMPTQQPH
jgi:hypothetical protein